MQTPTSPGLHSTNEWNPIRSRKLGEAFARAGGLALFILLTVIFFAVISQGKFLEFQNLMGILRYMSTLAIVGLGLTVVLILGDIDLSFGSVYGLAGTTLAVAWMSWSFPLWIALLISLVAALLVGVLNATLVCFVRLPAFIATLGTGTLAIGFVLLIGNAERFTPAYPTAGEEVSSRELSFFEGISNLSLPAGIPMQVIWMVLIAVAFWILLHRSLFGFRARAIGGNITAARLAGLPVTKYRFIAFGLVALTAAVAVFLDFAFIGSVSPDSGTSLLFPVFAAVIIGGASLSGGRGTVGGTLLGSLLLAVMANGLALMAAAPYVQQLFLGFVTIGAVVLDQGTRAWRSR
ncbi:MAG: Ribose import permease protein RbsC [Nitrospira sp.]|nr:Ribose import permease protein RbsC [Nitrospira sp.]